MKVLISWNAMGNDFFLDQERNPTGINPDGTHGELYQNFSDYSRHYLLNTGSEEDDNLVFATLVNHLSSFSTMKVIPRLMDIRDPTDVGEIKIKLTPLLLDLKDLEIDVYISPGTPAMQTVWYLFGQENKINLRMFKITPPRFRSTIKPTRDYLKFEFSNVATTAYVLEQEYRKKNKKSKNTPFVYTSNHESFDLANKVASMDDITVLILGETGTGKEVIAKYIHENSERAKKPFKAFNCAAFNDDLLESKLFGHEKGAFTGAIGKYNGIFTQAHTGTVFLDEIGDISKKMQVTLLRFLQERTITRLGSEKQEKVDVRVIAATNNDLWQKVQDGDFRADLFFRLAVAEIPLIPLRNYSKKDKKDLFENVHQKVAERLKKPLLEIEDEVVEALENYNFPGNIRELEHWHERWFTYCNGKVSINDFKPRLNNQSLDFVSNLQEAERIHIQKVLDMYKGKTTKAVCEALGLRFETFKSKLKKYNLEFL